MRFTFARGPLLRLSNCVSPQMTGPSNVGASTSKPGRQSAKQKAVAAAKATATLRNAHELTKNLAQQFCAAVLETRHVVVLERMFEARDQPV